MPQRLGVLASDRSYLSVTVGGTASELHRLALRLCPIRFRHLQATYSILHIIKEFGEQCKRIYPVRFPSGLKLLRAEPNGVNLSLCVPSFKGEGEE